MRSSAFGVFPAFPRLFRERERAAYHRSRRNAAASSHPRRGFKIAVDALRVHLAAYSVLREQSSRGVSRFDGLREIRRLNAFEAGEQSFELRRRITPRFFEQRRRFLQKRDTQRRRKKPDLRRREGVPLLVFLDERRRAPRRDLRAEFRKRIGKRRDPQPCAPQPRRHRGQLLPPRVQALFRQERDLFFEPVKIRGEELVENGGAVPLSSPYCRPSPSEQRADGRFHPPFFTL